MNLNINWVSVFQLEIQYLQLFFRMPAFSIWHIFFILALGQSPVQISMTSAIVYSVFYILYRGLTEEWFILLQLGILIFFLALKLDVYFIFKEKEKIEKPFTWLSMITLKNKVTERSLKNARFFRKEKMSYFIQKKKCHILYRRKNVIIYTEEKTSYIIQKKKRHILYRRKKTSYFVQKKKPSYFIQKKKRHILHRRKNVIFYTEVKEKALNK